MCPIQGRSCFDLEVDFKTLAPESGAPGTVTIKDSQLQNRRIINAAPSAPTFSAFGANELRCPSLDSPTKEFP